VSRVAAGALGIPPLSERVDPGAEIGRELDSGLDPHAFALP
jgi:hypothetical protein